MKRVYRVYKKTVSIVNETATGMYENLVGKEKGFLLESYDKNYDRFTLFGVNPAEIIRSKGQSLEILHENGDITRKEGNPLELLKEYYSEFEIRRNEGEIGFSGGLVGNLGYDFVRYTETLPDENPDEIGIETIQMMLMKEFIVVDHIAETLTGIVLEEDNEEGKQRAMEKASEMIAKARRKIQETPRKFCLDGKIIKKSDTLEEYGSKVLKIKDYIKEGHVFQTVLSQRWTIETGQDGFELYKELRELNPSPYLYYFNYGDFEVIGSSPEMIVKKQDDRVYTCPIAGTRKRGKDDAEDAVLKEEDRKSTRLNSSH